MNMISKGVLAAIEILQEVSERFEGNEVATTVPEYLRL